MNDSERNVKEQIINNIKRINNIVNDSEKANGFELNIGNNDGNDIEFWKRI